MLLAIYSNSRVLYRKYKYCTELILDINECLLNVAICGVGTCINTKGNYTCVCPEGHLLMPDRNCMGQCNDAKCMSVIG